MASDKPPQFFKWRYLLFLYIIVVLTSLIVSEFTVDESLTESYSINSDLETVLFFPDPILSNLNSDSIDPSDKNLISIHSDGISFEEWAKTAKILVDSLSIYQVHIIGEGIGASAAVHFVDLFPEQASSLILVSANGVEELELLGGFHLNQAIYNVKHIFYRSLKIIVPHYGNTNWFDKHIAKAKTQIASDQRLIRALMTEINLPTEIYHLSNSKVSIQLSKEHQRIIPQSALYELENYLIASNQLKLFYESIIDGEAIMRSDTSIEKQREALQAFDPANGIKAEGTGLLILMLIIILSTLISEDLTCIGTGLMIARGLIGFFPGTLACLIGIFFGDILLYLAGRWLASSTLHKAPLKWFISEDDIKLSYHWFEAKGPSIIIASRFIPGTRFPTYFSAGAIGASFLMFIFYFGVASIIWTPILVGLAMFLGQEMIDYFAIYQDYALWVLFGVLAILFVVFKVIIPSFTYKGRRLLVGWWKRKIHWEFWSPYVLYAPVLAYTVALWIKHRSIALVTLANPGIKFGGFIKESKSEILSSFGNESSIAKFEIIPDQNSFEQNFELVKEFMSIHSLEFPIVLKPDVGERGKGVVIVKTITQLEIELKKIRSKHIVQEYIDGEEFGVFYYRRPSQKNGQILSITRKNYLWLEGDGKHTLEELILKHPRAVCLAEQHFQQHIDHLYTIPKKGKKIKLVELGTHARGSIFLDAIQLNSKNLITEIDRISKQTPGFYFGRFDIKVPNEQMLKEGNNLKVLELNGVTSEATHIYDPKYNYFYAAQFLMKQWKLAYEIASENKSINEELRIPRIWEVLALLR